MNIKMVYVKGTHADMKPSKRKSTSFKGSLFTKMEAVPFPVAIGNALLDEFDFVGYFNKIVEWDPKQWKVTPGDAIKSMVLSLINEGQRPSLMDVSGFFYDMPVNILFDSVSHPDDLNRYKLAETLDRLYEAGLERTFYDISAALRANYNIHSTAVHSDTTSIRVWGEYLNEKGDLDITKGYSKDHRPDLNQYELGLVVDDNGVPVYYKVLDGNTADTEWNKMCLDSIEEFLKEEQPVYVADSKLITSDLVKRMTASKTKFLSRLPANFGDRLQWKTFKNLDMSSLEEVPLAPGSKKKTARYATETSTVFDGHKLRLIPYRSSALAGKGDAAIKKERKIVEDEIEAFPKIYECRNDAEKAFNKFKKRIERRHPMFKLKSRVESLTVTQRKQGRPRKDGSDVHVTMMFRIDVEYEEDEDVREQTWRSEEMIILISNVPTKEEDPDNGMDRNELIWLYSNEWKVECKFKTTKKPAIADALYLKRPDRSEALIYIFNFAVLLRGLIQLMLRRGLEKVEDENLPHIGYDNQKLQRNITADFFIKKFYKIRIYCFDDGYCFSNEKQLSVANFLLGLMDIGVSELF